MEHGCICHGDYSIESKVFVELFLFKALTKFKIAEKATFKRGNKVCADGLKLTRNTDCPIVRRVFQLMWERAKLLKPAVTFDPLGIFEDEDLYR